MKEWNKPELLSLGVENTFDGNCTCSAVGSADDWSTLKANKHPCHKTGNGEHNDSGNHTEGVEQNGHNLSVGCPDTTHYKNGKVICCCYGRTVTTS